MSTDNFTDALKLLHDGVSVEDVQKITTLPIEAVRALAIEKELFPSSSDRIAKRSSYSQHLTMRVENAVLETASHLIDKVHNDIKDDSTDEEAVVRTTRLKMQTDMVSKLLGSLKKSVSATVNMIQSNGKDTQNTVIDISNLSE